MVKNSDGCHCVAEIQTMEPELLQLVGRCEFKYGTVEEAGVLEVQFSKAFECLKNGLKIFRRILCPKYRDIPGVEILLGGDRNGLRQDYLLEGRAGFQE
jgi:hypothetical protein